MALPDHRRPKSLGGTGSDPVWVLMERHLPDGLQCRDDPDLEGHAFLEPSWRMPIQDYELLLGETRPRWKEHTDDR
jgi:hypothetical protein